jgi:hypothetical protein
LQKTLQIIVEGLISEKQRGLGIEITPPRAGDGNRRFTIKVTGDLSRYRTPVDGRDYPPL